MSWAGMNADDGTRCVELDHLRQSIRDILTTPVGSRVMRREYGSFIPELIDQPLTKATRQRVMAATVMAVYRWEPRVRIDRIGLEQGDQPGELFVSLEGVRVDGARRRRLDPLLVQIRGFRQ